MKNFNKITLSLVFVIGIGLTVLNFVSCSKEDIDYSSWNGQLCSRCDKEHPCNAGLTCAMFKITVTGNYNYDTFTNYCATASTTTCP